MSSQNHKTIWLVFLPLTLEIWTVFVPREGAGYRDTCRTSVTYLAWLWPSQPCCSPGTDKPPSHLAVLTHVGHLPKRGSGTGPQDPQASSILTDAMTSIKQDQHGLILPGLGNIWLCLHLQYQAELHPCLHQQQARVWTWKTTCLCSSSEMNPVYGRAEQLVHCTQAFDSNM